VLGQHYALVLGFRNAAVRHQTSASN
jgi:hypothetical protein